MLNHPTLNKLQQLKFAGMATALAEQMSNPDFETFAFEERLGLLVDRKRSTNRILNCRVISR